MTTSPAWAPLCEDDQRVIALEVSRTPGPNSHPRALHVSTVAARVGCCHAWEYGFADANSEGFFPSPDNEPVLVRMVMVCSRGYLRSGFLSAPKGWIVMRHVFIQDSASKLLFRTVDEWTADPKSARDFKTSLNAVAFCLQNDLTSAHIVIRFEGPDVREVVIPVQRERPVLGTAP